MRGQELGFLCCSQMSEHSPIPTIFNGRIFLRIRLVSYQDGRKVRGSLIGGFRSWCEDNLAVCCCLTIKASVSNVFINWHQVCKNFHLQQGLSWNAWTLDHSFCKVINLFQQKFLLKAVKKVNNLFHPFGSFLMDHGSQPFGKIVEGLSSFESYPHWSF